MLSIGRMAAGQGGYYLELAREDYYLDGGEPPGKWWGRGASKFGLSGQVKRRQLERLLGGFSPAGMKLVQNAGQNNHRPGFDLTFSAPKSVSVLWSQADERARREIQGAHEAAVGAALGYLQDSAAFTRRGKGGSEALKADLVVAAFEHGTSRALDPQLHTHALVMNIGVTADGRSGALEGHALYEHKMTAGALYRAELGSELRSRLGVEIETQRTWFEVRGVPKSLIEIFSKRRAAIEAELSARGLESASAAAFAAHATRDVKTIVPPRSELFSRWQDEGLSHGFGPERATALLGRHSQATRNLQAEFHAAVETLTRSESYFSEAQVLRTMAERLQDGSARVQEIREAASDGLQSPEIVYLGEKQGQARFTTRAVLAAEERMLEAARALGERREHGVKPRLVEGVLKKAGQLNDQQQAALRYLTDAEGGSIRLVNGMAGTGKTTMLRAAREAWERAGYRVQGVSLSGKAAKELQKGSGIESDTLAMLEIRMDASLLTEWKHHAKQIVRAAFGKPTYRFNPFAIDKNTVLVIDEAGMLGTKQLARLIEATKKGGGLLVLVGDRRQLQPIEAGGPFAALLDRLEHKELTKIIRQRDARDRDAVSAVSRGEAREVLRSFADRGLLSISESREAALSKLVSDWSEREAHGPQDSLILCGMNREADEINRLCQEARRRAAQLGKLSISLGDTIFYEGDRVLLTKRSRALAIENGEIGTISSLSQLRRTITVQIDGGERRIIPLRDYKQVRLGYAVTTHKAQGTTVERSYVLAGGPMQDRELSYVQLSRARGETRVYVDENEVGERLSALIRQMELSRQKELALAAAQTRRVLT